jgi:hypothetical protein
MNWRAWKVCRLLCLLGLHVSLRSAYVAHLKACNHCRTVLTPF